MSTPVKLLAEQLEAAYEEHAGRVALYAEDGTATTFAELRSRSSRFADGLRQLGATPGDRVMLLAPNRPEWVTADQALCRSRLARVPILPRLHGAEVAQIVEDVKPFGAVVDAGWLRQNGTEPLRGLRGPLIGLGEVEELPDGCLPFEEVLASGTERELGGARPDDVGWVMYTSGSTGRPKGVIATQFSLGASMRNTLGAIPGLNPADALLHTAPISHFSGQVLIGAFLAGASNRLQERFDTGAVIDAAERGEVTILPLVPTQINLLVDDLVARGHEPGGIGSVRLVVYAGSAIDPSRAERAVEELGEVMLQFYGASESPLPMTALNPAEHVIEGPAAVRLASAGRATEHVRIEVVDAEHEPLPAGESGEVRIAGEHLSVGYWERPEETAETFVDGWLYSGDIGYLDEEGYLFLVDRRKDMIVSGGFNVYSREVEIAIAGLDGVAEVAVVGAPDERWGETIVAFVGTEPGAELDAETVIEFCRGSIAGYKVPRRIEFVTELPRTGAGKVKKADLREGLWAGRGRSI